MMKKIIIFFSTVIITIVSYGQEGAETESTREEISMKGASRLTLGLGHEHVAEGVVDGKKKWIVIPSWSLNYDYWLSRKWALGLQADLLLETFVIEDDKGEDIERNHPVSLVPVGIFKFSKHFSAVAGTGVELAKENNIWLTRLALEAGWELPKEWELGAALVWDGKWKYYNSWGIAITVSKIWPSKHRQ